MERKHSDRNTLKLGASSFLYIMHIYIYPAYINVKDQLHTLSVSKMAGSKIYSKCMPCVDIRNGLAHNDSRFILVQSILPYVQSEVGRMYYLSPDARESLKSYRLSSGG
jgi:hypothetical protein